MTRRPWLACSLLLTTLGVAVAPASAQIGGLVRRAKSAVADPKPTQEAAPTILPEDQLTAEHLESFGKGLDAEDAYRKQAARLAAAVKSKSDYEACQVTTMQSPDYQKVMTSYTDEMQKANGKVDASQAAMQHFADNLKALMLTKCGADPSEVGPGHEGRVASEAEAAGAKAAGVPAKRYAQWKERVVPFCNLAASKRKSGIVHAEGMGYLPNETEALSPRCDALMAKITPGS